VSHGRLRKLVDEGVFSKSLFESLDEAKAQLVENQTRKETFSAEVAAARSKVQALYCPEALIEAIQAGDPELRLKLKTEIAKRVEKIGINFSKSAVTATVVFVKGCRKAVFINGDRITLAYQQNYVRP
jgi:hypothetical protein